MAHGRSTVLFSHNPQILVNPIETFSLPSVHETLPSYEVMIIIYLSLKHITHRRNHLPEGRERDE